MKLLSQIISWLFMPLLMPLYAIWIVLFIPSYQLPNEYGAIQTIEYTPEMRWTIFLTFAIFCLVAPGLSVIIMKRSGLIKSIEVEEQKERNLPLIVTLFYCIVMFVMMKNRISNEFLASYIFALPLSCLVVNVAMLIGNRFMKISLHAAGAGILTGYLIAFTFSQLAYNYGIIIFSIFASGLVISSRLYLKKHTPIQLILGYSIALLLSFSTTYYYDL